MNKQKVALRYKDAVYVPALPKIEAENPLLVASINSELMRKGFVLTQEASTKLARYTTSQLIILYSEIITEAKARVGANVAYEPMYPNFPAQVMEASNFELYMNAICHYWSAGTWTPEYTEVLREFGFEDVKFKALSCISEEELKTVFPSILSSNDSISDVDKEVLTFFMDTYEDAELTYPTISFKETMCFVAAHLIAKKRDAKSIPKTATDVLRIATGLSDGDISLATNTKFRSMPRQLRRMLVESLEQVATLDDFFRHRNKWVRLFHSMHINEITKSDSLKEMVAKVRSGESVPTTNGAVEKWLKMGDLPKAIAILETRPGDFARRLSQVLGATKTGRLDVVAKFLAVADKVSTRVLLQLYGSFKVRSATTVDKRVVFPKGSIAKAQIIRTPRPKLGLNTVNRLLEGIRYLLSARFSAFGELGVVYVDPELANCPLPTAQRSASEGLVQVARGTRIPFGDDKSTLRLFIHWVGQDIDLSCTFHDENFKTVSRTSYTNLKNDEFASYHSGDIVDASAPGGAVEFIDVDIEKSVQAGARYVAMNVLVFSGPTFAEHEACYAGWMTRSKPKSNEIFDPRTVEQKIDLRSDCKNAVVVMFDLVTRKAIWTDLATKRGSAWGGNNVESNCASIEEKLEAITSLDNKVNLEELFMLHAGGRCTFITEDPEKADTIFSMNKGITPRDITLINSEYIADAKEAPKMVEV